MPSFTEVVTAYFEGLNWPTSPIPGRPILQLGFSSERGEWTCLLHIRETQSQVLFYSLYPDKAPEARRAVMAEFLTRGNYGLAVGNFEMDYADGEIRYKTTLDTQGEPLTPALLKGIVLPNLATMRAYFPAIAAVLAGADPEAALAMTRE